MPNLMHFTVRAMFYLLYMLLKGVNFSKVLARATHCSKIHPYGKSRYQNQNRGRRPALQIQSVGLALHGGYFLWRCHHVLFPVWQASGPLPDDLQKDFGQVTGGVFTLLQGTGPNAGRRPQEASQRLMFSRLLAVLDSAPRRVFLALGTICFGMLGYGLYLQLYAGLNPCPMCIVQRYALIFVAIIALLAGSGARKGLHIAGAVLLLAGAGFGAFVAARQSWLQWYPPEVATCGRDFYGMIESFPLQRAIPMIFKGSGDCSAVDWTFLGGTLANWSFLTFTTFGVLAVLMLWRFTRSAR